MGRFMTQSKIRNGHDEANECSDASAYNCKPKVIGTRRMPSGAKYMFGIAPKLNLHVGTVKSGALSIT